MKLEAMKRQGERTDLTSDPLGWKSGGKESAEIVGKDSGDSQTQVRRYIRLTNLISPLLDMVDDGKIAFRPAVELSYLSQNEQQSLLDTMSFEDATPSLAQALKMKEFSKDGRLSGDVILSIMSEEKPNQKEKYTFQADRLRQYIPSGYSRHQTEEYVVKALAHYQRFLNRQRDMER
jgi:ParB family chromosome partitioning protein